jgi:GTP cyclohydrolase I
MGVAHVGYLPGKVVGISKLARLVHCFAKRLQIQERMTQQIARAVETHLEAQGVGVIVTAHHLCMGCRGVKLPATQLVTSAMLGTLRNSAETRSEFLRLCGTT